MMNTIRYNLKPWIRSSSFSIIDMGRISISDYKIIANYKLEISSCSTPHEIKMTINLYCCKRCDNFKIKIKDEKINYIFDFIMLYNWR